VAPAPGEVLSAIDACFEQLTVPHPDADALLAALRDQRWPVKIAAAEVLGRCGCTQAAPELRALLKAEHAISVGTLYPPDGATGEAAGKRWRLKVALIVALGRLRDRDSVPVLGRILADHHDFYPVHSVAVQALGRIGGPDALVALTPALKDGEDNTQLRAKAARVVLKAEGCG
jgi:HEAT repeat protein